MGAEAATVALVVAPVCALADAVAGGLSRGAGWASLGGLPQLPLACAALRPAPPGRAFADYSPGLALWRAQHGAAAVTQTLLFAVVLIPLARTLLERVFDAAGRAALRTPAVAAGKVTLSAGKLKKWREACWKLVSYGALTLFGLRVILGQPWASDTQLLWKGWPLQHQHSDEMRYFYAWQMGHYLYGLVDQLVWESRRKDHAAMVVHHACTFALLAVSFSYSFLRVGALIEVLHDACDVWMEAAKLFNYAGYSNISTAIFVLFISSWLALRLAYFPLVVIRSTSVEAATVLLGAFGPSAYNRAIWAGFNVLLLVLLALHVYWFYFILLIAVRTLTSKIADVRSDDEEEEDEPAAVKPAAASRKKKE